MRVALLAFLTIASLGLPSLIEARERILERQAQTIQFIIK
jgi:hypothetical protein